MQNYFGRSRNSAFAGSKVVSGRQRASHTNQGSRGVVGDNRLSLYV